MKFRLDTFTLLLLGAIVLATFLPVRGDAANALATAGTVAVSYTHLTLPTKAYV